MNGLVASKFDTPINHDSMEAIFLFVPLNIFY